MGAEHVGIVPIIFRELKVLFVRRYSCPYDVIVGKVEPYDDNCIIVSLTRILFEECAMRLYSFTEEYISYEIIDNMPLLFIIVPKINISAIRKSLIENKREATDAELVNLYPYDATELKIVPLTQLAHFVINILQNLSNLQDV